MVERLAYFYPLPARRIIRRISAAIGARDAAGWNERIQPIDLMLFATPAKLFDMIERYGEYGRPFYRNVELTIDILYPLVYLLFFGFLISWLFERGLPPKSPYRKLNVMPLGLVL